MRVVKMNLYSFTLQSSNKSKLHDKKKLVLRQTTLTWSGSKMLDFPLYLKAPCKRACNTFTRYTHNHIIGTHFPGSKGVPISSICCTVLAIHTYGHIISFPYSFTPTLVTNLLALFQTGFLPLFGGCLSRSGRNHIWPPIVSPVATNCSRAH